MRLATVLLLLLVAAGSARADGLVRTESKRTVKETVDRLVAEIEKRGIKVVARVDHSAAARAAGLELPPTEVLVFGNPKLGTPLMQSNPSIGIDLPMTMLTWQDAAGKVWIGYNPPETLKTRHAVTGHDQIFTTMRGALEAIAAGASAP